MGQGPLLLEPGDQVRNVFGILVYRHAGRFVEGVEDVAESGEEAGGGTHRASISTTSSPSQAEATQSSE